MKRENLLLDLVFEQYCQNSDILSELALWIGFSVALPAVGKQMWSSASDICVWVPRTSLGTSELHNFWDSRCISPPAPWVGDLHGNVCEISVEARASE